jgi:hypothetical protein
MSYKQTKKVGDDLTLRAGSRHWAAYLDWLSAQGAVFGDNSGQVSAQTHKGRAHAHTP